jgi:hypothetical protein
MRQHAQPLSRANGNYIAACRLEWATFKNILARDVQHGVATMSR